MLDVGMLAKETKGKSHSSEAITSHLTSDCCFDFHDIGPPFSRNTKPEVERRLFKSALSYKDALSQDPINWPLAIKEELQSLEENGAAFRFLIAISVFNG